MEASLGPFVIPIDGSSIQLDGRVIASYKYSVVPL